MAWNSFFGGREDQSFPRTVDIQNPSVQADSLMTPEVRDLGEYFREEYYMRCADMEQEITEWDKIEQAYRCERDPSSPDPSYPNNFVAVITPVVEGQIASIIEANIEFTCQSRSPGMEGFMSVLDAGGSYIRDRNMFLQSFKDFGRQYDLLGNALVTVHWEKENYRSKRLPSGYPRIAIPDVRDIIIDGKIRDYKDLQCAEYIIERMGAYSIGWAKSEYGEEIANAIAVGVEMEDEGQNTFDHRDAFVLLHVWTRKNKYGNLQLIEMDTNGFVLRFSDPKKPYYSRTHNQYPYYMARMIPKLDSLYGIGDGKMIYKAQEIINKLTDEIELAARFSAQAKWAIDPRGKAKISQINSDPSKPFLIENPNQNIRIIQAQGINSVVFNYIEFLLREVQRMTRFHDIMTGNMNTASATATQINSQMAQGSVGINDKKTDISHAMAWAYRYCLQLCLEKWDIPMWGRTGDDVYTWVDFDQIRSAPATVPISGEKVEEITSMGGNPPEYEFLETKPKKKGKLPIRLMEELDFDVKIVIGQGIQKDNVSMFNMLQSLSQLQIVDEQGVPKPVLMYTKAVKMFEDILGIKLSDPATDPSVTMQNQLTQMMEQLAALNPVTSDQVQPPSGSNIPSLAPNLAGSVPGTGMTDTRGMV